MQTKTTYQAENSQEALNIYSGVYGDLYRKAHSRVIKKMLSKIFKGSDWRSLKILEIGGGGGFWTDFFLKAGADVACVDVYKEILEGNQKLHPEAKFILGDATVLKFDEKFDFIFVKDVIEHIERDEGFLKNMSGHIKEGGIIMLTTQNSFSLNYLVEGLFWNFLLKKNKNWCGWDPTHVRFYNFKSLDKKLKEASFKAERWFSAYHLPYRIITRRIPFGEKLEFKILHSIELAGLYDKFPFNITGWNIGVIAKKITK